MIRKALRRLYWRLRPARCECGYLIWPWHDRVYDADLGGYIHGSCASYPDECPCPTCDVDEDAPNPACASWVHPGNGPGLPAEPTHHPRCLSLTGGDLRHVCDCETLRLLGVPESTEQEPTDG